MSNEVIQRNDNFGSGTFHDWYHDIPRFSAILLIVSTPLFVYMMPGTGVGSTWFVSQKRRDDAEKCK